METNFKKLPMKDKVFDIIIICLTGVFSLIILIPLINIVACSFSSPAAVANGRVLLWPVDFSLKGYTAVFSYKGIWRAYANTLFYTVTGTLINLVFTFMAAYPLAKRELPFNGVIMFLFTFTMVFVPGMISNYININNLKMTNTIWAILIPGAISAYNMIIARTFIMGIPKEIEEAAIIDGCNETQYFFSMVLPLSKTVIAVLALYYAVAHWNDYISAFLYISDQNLMPLQMKLREILVANSIQGDAMVDAETVRALFGMSDLLKYSLIIVSCVPILILYPFVKKFFIKGVMIGSIKG